VVHVTLADAAAKTVPMALDTVIIEPDDHRVVMLWRGNLVLRTGPHDVREIVASA
jgi:hypothetical protein